MISLRDGLRLNSLDKGRSEQRVRLSPVPMHNVSGSSGEARERDSYAVTAVADIVDRSLNAAIARVSLGLSPAALAEAFLDWSTHLAFAPGKRLQLVDKAMRKAIRFLNYTCRCGSQIQPSERCIEPLPQDRRFAAEVWQKWPYNF